MSFLGMREEVKDFRFEFLVAEKVNELPRLLFQTG